jgi:predicted metal-dependent phosphoesterase TrpH
MKYDLHTHSKYSSDGILEVKRIVSIAKKRGLRGIAITDHNSIKGGLEAKKYETKEFSVIVGSEIKTQRGEIIGLFLSDDIKSRSAESVMAEIKDQNGLITIPHPFDEMRKSAFHPLKEDVKYIDAVEIFNSRCVYQKYNKSALDFATTQNLGMTAGSDGHFANEIGMGGIITSSNDIREAIINKDVEVFGRRSSVVNHGLTKGLKLWRRSRSG